MTVSYRQAGPWILGLLLSFPTYGYTAEKAKPIELPPVPKVFEKKDPESIADLKEIENHTEELVKRLTPCVVNLRLGGSEGSGVVIDDEGHVLTAGHVSGKPGISVTIIFPDGKEVKGKTLGMNSDIDSGMVQITDEGKYPYVEMGKSADLKKGDWVLTLGHPNGMKKGRPPVVRVARITALTKSSITTGTYLVGGDSGGPLFDMSGKVVGIHSRIGENISENVHVPVDTYRDTWDKLVAGDEIGKPVYLRPNTAFLGAEVELKENELVFSKVEKDSPAEKGGIKVGDVLIKMEDKAISTVTEFRRQLLRKKPEEEMTIEVKRGEKSVVLTVKLGASPPIIRKKKN